MRTPRAALLVAALALGCGSATPPDRVARPAGDGKPDAPADAAGRPPLVIVTSPRDVWREWRANEVAARRHFEGRTLEVHVASVAEIKAGGGGRSAVALWVGRADGLVIATFAPGREGVVAKLQRGRAFVTPVALRGRFVSVGPVFPETPGPDAALTLGDCEFLTAPELAPPPFWTPDPNDPDERLRRHKAEREKERQAEREKAAAKAKAKAD